MATSSEETEDRLRVAYLLPPGVSRAPSMDLTIVSDRVANESDPFPLDDQSLHLLDGAVLEREIGDIAAAPSVEGSENSSIGEAQPVLSPERAASVQHSVESVDGGESKPTTSKKRRKKSRTCKKRSTTSLMPDVLVYVDKPTNLDVLLGRGGKTNRHPGNKRYRKEVKKLQQQYMHTPTKDEKTKISELVFKNVHGYGGRFLKKMKGGGGWYVVPTIVARRKSSQALREMKRSPLPKRRRRERVHVVAREG